LQPTALVHEAYLRLAGGEESEHWNGRGHFFAAAAEAMRRILVENARRKSRQKHGGELKRRDLRVVEPSVSGDDDRVLAVHEALKRMACKHPQKAKLVKLRYFGGLTLAEAASVLGIASATADRHWSFARAWLAREIRRGSPPDTD
jgi:RNA polymerase sigma factor (TIGR02999 family)